MNKLTARALLCQGTILVKNPPQTPDRISLGHCSDFMIKQGVLPGSMVMSRPWEEHEYS